MMETAYRGTNRLIIGIVFGVLTFWLFAQAMVNIVPAIQKNLGISAGTVNIAISLTAFFRVSLLLLRAVLPIKSAEKKSRMSA